MTNVVCLLDPHILVPLTLEGIPDDEEFWQRVVNVAASGTFSIGHESFYWVVDQLQERGYPDRRIDFGPPEFRRECQTAVEKILTRVSRGSDEIAEASLSPAYLGAEDAALSIVIDATQHSSTVAALMSDTRHWVDQEPLLAIGDLEIELLFDPLDEPKILSSRAAKVAFEGRQLHVVGGELTESLGRALDVELGIPTPSVHWIVSEKAKPARDLDKRWGSLNPAKDIAVCITGRVPHAVWEQADKAADKCGVKMIECHSQGQLVDALRGWATQA
ncbi:hypothetical protein [Curtobacterium sp. MCLR17_058]|uniref:hypothetical protein n=1 Tax=Curtobacterium sp. MCLR17_058 TaxID=2175635 RepID=UPI0011B36E30|nr:hypothetical protein [Curtobacterium sp. MCLR17_058]WIB42684.1 hypothetical protein DEJ11_17900 [Curtobacterium sp. MCLR17_058]